MDKEKFAKNKKIVGQALSAVSGFLLGGIGTTAKKMDTDTEPAKVNNLSDGSGDDPNSEKDAKQKNMFLLLGGAALLFFLTKK